MRIIQSRSFEKKVRRFQKQQKKVLGQEVRKIAGNPSSGEEKRGELRGVFVYKFGNRRWRTCVSRAYYAIFSAATGALTESGVTMPHGRDNPSHQRLPGLSGNNLRRGSHPLQWRLAGLVEDLYRARFGADYRPSVVIGQREVAMAIGFMNRAFECLRGKP